MGHHAEGFNRLTFLVVDGDGRVSLLCSLFVVVGGEYVKGPGDIWAVKGYILAVRLLMLVKLTPLRFSLNALFRGQAGRSLRRMLP